MADVQLTGVVKRYGEVVAVNGIDLHIKSGEFVTLLGPSGCGKTTTLRCIAGLEKTDGGEIRIGDVVVSGRGVFVPPDRRELGMIFQSYAIWPHMTVFDNVAYGLKIKRLPRAQIEERVRRALEIVGLASYANRYATQLSGGQQQRVAVARSVALQPKVLLFDEPLSNLDAKLREQMRFELRELQRQVGITSIYVTHDQSEAMAMSDRIVLMKDGNIVQQGPPAEVYLKPNSVFAADFLGLMNFVVATVAEHRPDGFTVCRRGELEFVCRPAQPVPVGEDVVLGVRPEQIKLWWTRPEGEANVWPVTIQQYTYLGHQVDVKVRLDGMTWRLAAHPNELEKVSSGARAFLSADPTRITWIPERLSELTPAERALVQGAA